MLTLTKKKILNIFLLVILFLLVSLGAAYLAKDRILSFMVPKIISRMLGSTIRVKNISLSASEQSLLIEGLEVFNPPGFPNQVMLDIPLIQANIDVDSLLRRRIYLPFLKINIETIHIYFNSKQQSNIEAALTAKFAEAAVSLWPYQIDRLALVLGRVQVTELKNIEKPDVSSHFIYNYQVYEDISDVKYLGAYLVIDAIKMANIRGLTLQGISSVSSSLMSPLKKVGSYVGLDSLTEVVPISTTTASKVLFLPYETAEKIVGGRTVKVKLAVGLERTYQGVLRVLRKYGKITKDNESKGKIVAKVSAIKIVVRLKAVPGGTELIIDASEGMRTKPHFSRALVYYLARDLAKDHPAQSTKSLFIK